MYAWELKTTCHSSCIYCPPQHYSDIMQWACGLMLNRNCQAFKPKHTFVGNEKESNIPWPTFTKFSFLETVLVEDVIWVITVIRRCQLREMLWKSNLRGFVNVAPNQKYLQILIFATKLTGLTDWFFISLWIEADIYTNKKVYEGKRTELYKDMVVF